MFNRGYILFCIVSITFAQNDPFESLNRAVYGFNYVIDSSFFRPIIKVYRNSPQFVIQSVSNFSNNLTAPLRFVSLLLAGNFSDAKNEFFAFILNSTVGILGFLDPSKELGILTTEFDLDLTLKAWGVDTGPFLMLPLLGPSSLRALCPSFLSNFLTPDFWLVREHDKWYGLIVVEGINKRSNLEPFIENVEKMSFDTYTIVRNFYLTNRSINFKLDGDDLMDEDY
ncbi:MAG: VacJ family lipoprotein [Deltaproteobacteria bacterium]|nr:VacJ family lipoprotein [Deltaproteobacteria bacterium]